MSGRDKPLPPVIAEILRLAVYELQFSAAKDFAVVSEWVNLAKRYGHRGTAGLVNAVLRSFLRDRPAAPTPEDFDNEDDYLGTLYSYPTWIVRLGWRLFRQLIIIIPLRKLHMAFILYHKRLITVNRRRAPRMRPGGWFAQREVKTQPSELAGDSLLLEGGALAAAGQSDSGEAWWLQSESSAMVVDVLNPQPDDKVIDACTGRGNKALQIAARVSDERPVLCIDRDRRKIQLLERRAAAADLKVEAVAEDATAPVTTQRADRILIDAPCSGLGVLGRHPEARWRKRPDDGERLALTQRALLEALAPQLFEGGAIVYAVCSTDPRETTDVIEWFLSAHNVQRGLIPARFAELQTGAGDLLVPPGLHGRDGFYVARLERR